MLIIGLAILFILFFAGGLYILGRWGEDDEGAFGLGIIMAIVGLIGGIVLLLTSIIMPIDNLGKASRIEAFYEANFQNYSTTVDMTENVLTISLEEVEKQALIDLEGSIEKVGMGEAVAARIAEFRDKVNSYNKEVKYMRAMDGNIMVGIYYPTLPDNIKLIVITD